MEQILNLIKKLNNLPNYTNEELFQNIWKKDIIRDLIGEENIIELIEIYNINISKSKNYGTYKEAFAYLKKIRFQIWLNWKQRNFLKQIIKTNNNWYIKK